MNFARFNFFSTHGDKIDVKVFEMAGLDRLDNKTTIAKSALRNIDGIIVVFDKSKPVS